MLAAGAEAGEASLTRFSFRDVIHIDTIAYPDATMARDLQLSPRRQHVQSIT
jgi:hypothetical protein